ncbi:MAG: bifunctional diaminohydroxyphosphoribosylaminopyrimidine [Bacteroidota bacterium]|jgi:diaminohydroxyphosphoribosylaminopyrimidine deaminase/5-amino-6-(5-phosphoribosylamino)uracil reductase
MNPKYMQRCFDLARLGNGQTSPNPSVGAVLVYQDKIIGEGWHRQYGGAHAEVNAVASVRAEHRSWIAQSTIYVSLEPCHHFGKTPPCVDLILRERIPKVVIAQMDPHDKVAGQSIQKLRNHGVEVIENVLMEEGKMVTRPFVKNIIWKKPYIILKWAESADGFMGSPDKQVWLSNALAKRLAHRWRNEVDAILVGSNTVLIDNPSLDNRYWFGKSPVRVVLDGQGRVGAALKNPKTELKILDDSIKTLIYSYVAHPLSGSNNKLPFQQTFFKTLNSNNPNELLDDLYHEKIGIVLVEGGASVLNFFIQNNLWDEARVFKTNKGLQAGIAAPKITSKKDVEMIQLLDNQLHLYQND